MQESKARSFMEVAREIFEIQNEHCEKIPKYETGRMLLITITEQKNHAIILIDANKTFSTI